MGSGKPETGKPNEAAWSPLAAPSPRRGTSRRAAASLQPGPRSNGRPLTPTPHPAASAYDAIAATYDEQVRGDEWMRRSLWDAYLRLFRPGQHILDVSCGTGIDAIFLARRGIRVTGIDISPGMIAQLEDKVARLGLGAWITAQVLDYADLDMLAGQHFDGLIAAFAGLSTAPDLAPFARSAAGLLPPGAPAVIHLLNRFSLWEWLGLVARGRWPAARALARYRERTFTIGGRPVSHYLWWPHEAACAFEQHFRLQRVYALGALRPPHTLRHLPPPLVTTLAALERSLRARRPLRNWGRLFVLELARRSG